MLSYLEVIGEQNDTVREWANTTDQIRIAASTTQDLQKLVSRLGTDKSLEEEDLIFSYIEQYRVLKGSLSHPVLQDKVNPETLIKLQTKVEKIQYHERLDIPYVAITLTEMLPELEHLFGSLNAQKRAIYIDSNEYIKENTKNLASISSSVLGLCVILGIILSFWITRSTTTRIRAMAKNANTVCKQNPGSHKKSFVSDELDELASCLTDISQQIFDNIAAEKLLEGAEDERRRIAMDIHDQFLSDLNHFKRDFTLLTQAQTTESDFATRASELNVRLDELAHSLRGIIDDLHPQALEMFGLEAALQGYIKRKLSAKNHPEYFIHIDATAESRLSLFQKITLYRIILESINNIISHANCTRYEIDLRKTVHDIELIIEDNGSGMNFETAIKQDGHGLFNIMQRTRSINASVVWESSRFSSGTKVKLELALNNLDLEPRAYNSQAAVYA